MRDIGVCRYLSANKTLLCGCIFGQDLQSFKKMMQITLWFILLLRNAEFLIAHSKFLSILGIFGANSAGLPKEKSTCRVCRNRYVAHLFYFPMQLPSQFP